MRTPGTVREGRRGAAAIHIKLHTFYTLIYTHNMDALPDTLPDTFT